MWKEYIGPNESWLYRVAEHANYQPGYINEVQIDERDGVYIACYTDGYTLHFIGASTDLDAAKMIADSCIECGLLPNGNTACFKLVCE